MDFASLKDQVANLSLYDLKAGVRKVQNGKVILKNRLYILSRMSPLIPLLIAVMNYTEMEAKVIPTLLSECEMLTTWFKVREATNNEPWGASSTLMQDIANGTYS